MAASGAAAQTAPSAPQPFIEEQRQQDRERALREQQERAVDVRLPTAPERTGARLPESEAPCFRIDRLVLEGERAGDFQWLLREAAGEQSDDSPLGHCLGTQGVNTVLERLQQALIARGWVTSRVLAAPQDLASGTLRLTLVPGRIAAIRFAEGTTDRSGALLSGNSVKLNLSGDLNNQGGTVAGRTTVALTADNINNLAGRITGKDVALVAGTDLNNIGGMIDAQHSLAVIAGRNVNIVTTTSDASSSAKTARGSIAQQRTVIDRVAGLYVSNPGGTLAVYAGGNIQATGA